MRCGTILTHQCFTGSREECHASNVSPETKGAVVAADTSSDGSRIQSTVIERFDLRMGCKDDRAGEIRT